MINKEFISSAVGTSVAAIGTAIQPNEMLQTISLIVTICAASVTFITGIVGLVVRLRRWWKKAKADGVITQEEIDEGIDILNNGLNEAKQNLNDIKSKSKKGETK